MEQVFSNNNFIIDYNKETNQMRVSYFENYHYINEAVFYFNPRCWGCKYYCQDNGYCSHPDASYCNHGELWRPKEK